VLIGYTIPVIAVPPLAPLSPSTRFCTTPSPAMGITIATMLRDSILRPGHFPIFNLRRLNAYLRPNKFRLTNNFQVGSFLQRGDWLAKIDLSNAYVHVPVQHTQQRFLALAYRERLYCMTCLPFGLASAPQIFAVLTNWVAVLLRSRGIRVLVYLDDFLLTIAMRPSSPPR